MGWEEGGWGLAVSTQGRHPTIKSEMGGRLIWAPDRRAHIQIEAKCHSASASTGPRRDDVCRVFTPMQESGNMTTCQHSGLNGMRVRRGIL